MRSDGLAAPDTRGQPHARAAARTRAHASRRPQRLTGELMDAFLAELADGWTVRDAAARADVRRRQTVYERRARDPEFAAAWDAAVEEGWRVLDEEADAELEERLASGQGVL